MDLSEALLVPIFGPRKDKAIFSKVAVDPELETIVWPNGVDLAPEFLKELYLNKASETLERIHNACNQTL